MTTCRTNAVSPGLAFYLLAACLLPVSGCKKGPESSTGSPASKANSTGYTDSLQQITGSPQLTLLNAPNYTDVQPQAQKFYADRNEEIAWTRDGKPTAAAKEVIGLFADAAKKGLRPEDYDASKWPQRLQRLDSIAASKDTSANAKLVLAQFDAALTISALRYVSALHSGRINPETLNFDIDTPGKRAAFDLPGFLNSQIVDGSDAVSAMAGVEPTNAMYLATEKALPQYLALAQQQDAAPRTDLPPVAKAVAVGGAYTALPALLLRLQLEGDSSTTATPAAFDQGLSDSVKHYQQRHGLTPNGQLTQATIDSMNVPFDNRVQQIDDTLERWRWLPDEFVQPAVLVNLPEFFVRTYEPGHTLAFKMKVVDGQAQGKHDTPMFVRSMRYVVFRPYWNVPPSIIKKEIVPHLVRSGVGYLPDKGYEVTTGAGQVVSDYTVADIEHLKYAVRQKPGAGNSLGLVKFLFPNEYNVYMHSTPELPLFNLTRRDKSHGCVRLEHADRMAQWVLSKQGDWDADRVSKAMNGTDDNKTINLKQTLPVVITYMTANADEDGSMHFFDDIYGYDKDLNNALAKGMPYEQEPVKINPKAEPGDTY